MRARLRNCRVFAASPRLPSTASASTRAAVLARAAHSHAHALVLHSRAGEQFRDDGSVTSRALRRLLGSDIDAIGPLREATGVPSDHEATVPAWWLARHGTVVRRQQLVDLDTPGAADRLVRLGESQPEQVVNASTAKSGDVDETLRRTLPTFLDHLRHAGIRHVAIYGAGSHTQRLLPLWQALSGPPITAIVVTVVDGPDRVLGLPLIPADMFDPDSVDAIVLSSQAFEREMSIVCEERWPDLPILRLYWHPACSLTGQSRHSASELANFGERRRAV